jgi:hypothetical protein
MIPRVVKMAKEVESQFTSAQLEDYGNVILNGYLSVVPNTTNKKAWQYKETTTAPVNLPSLTEVRPALKGWTTNYMEYFTRADSPAYPVYPGAPTMFEYVVHSYTTGNAPRWAQPPHRFYQNQVSGVTPPQNVNNPQVIQYSFVYPVVDNPTQPPIDYVTP